MTTLTDTEPLADPAVPVQVSVKTVLVVSVAVDSLLETGLAPDHTPAGVLEATQELVLLDDHVRVEEPPLVTEVLLVVSETDGNVVDETATLTVLATEPAAFEQVIVKLPVVVSDPVDSLPEVPLEPDHFPEAAQELAFVDDQVSWEDPPTETVMGFALSETVGRPLPPPSAPAPPSPLPPAPPPQAVSAPANSAKTIKRLSRAMAARIFFWTRIAFIA